MRESLESNTLLAITCKGEISQGKIIIRVIEVRIIPLLRWEEILLQEVQ
jgi:hypothetical protein